MAWGQVEDMTETTVFTLCSQAGCSGLARAISKHFVGDRLVLPDVLVGPESPAVKTIYSSSQNLIQGLRLEAVEQDGQTEEF